MKAKGYEVSQGKALNRRRGQKSVGWQSGRWVEADSAVSLSYLLSLYPCVAAPILTEHFNADCCINATRITIEVLKAFGFKAQAQSVLAAAVNAEFHRRVMEKRRWPEAVDTAEWTVAGAWAVATDIEQRPEDDAKGKWAGHVVALAQEGTDAFLIDASCGQMRRPLKQIYAPDVFIAKLPMVSDFACWEKGPTYFRYEVTKDRSYERRSGFERHEHNLYYAQEIESELKVRIHRDGRRVA